MTAVGVKLAATQLHGVMEPAVNSVKAEANIIRVTYNSVLALESRPVKVK
jgi:hypothetical protein